jgi:hypothetical protein
MVSAASISAEWRMVSFPSNREKGSSVLLKWTVSSSGYIVHLTDFCRLWGEELDNSQIISRAQQLETEIDPSQDKKQLHLLLSKLQGAAQGDLDSTLKLYKTRNGLQLDVLVNLPQPFQPLHWEVYLEMQSAQDFSTHVLQPIAQKSIVQSDQITHLVRLLHEKDSVLDKTLAFLESMKVDLGNVFPSLGRSSKADRNRVQAVGVIKGMAAFQDTTWIQDVEYNPRPVSSLLESILAENKVGSPNFHIPSDWTTQLSFKDEEQYQNPDKSLIVVSTDSEAGLIPTSSSNRDEIAEVSWLSVYKRTVILICIGPRNVQQLRSSCITRENREQG